MGSFSEFIRTLKEAKGPYTLSGRSVQLVIWLIILQKEFLYTLLVMVQFGQN